MDRDGTCSGYDLPITKKLSEELDVPIIASGGVGKPQHIYEGFSEGKADAALAASIFHFSEYSIREVKEYLRERKVPVRL
jgi:cyclase